MAKIQISFLSFAFALTILTLPLEGMSFTRYHSENYKKPDLRQQRQLAQHLLRCEHAQRDHHKQLRDENRRDRARMLVAFVKKQERLGEKQQVIDPEKLEKAQKIVQREQKREQRVVKRFGLDDTGTKAIIALTIASLCLASDGVCAVQKMATTNPGTGPIIKLSSSDQRVKEPWGPCEEHGNYKFCCDIGPNYTITCCKHVKNAANASCVVFDPDGIVNGAQSQSNISRALQDAENFCAQQPKSNSTNSQANSWWLVGQYRKPIGYFPLDECTSVSPGCVLPRREVLKNDIPVLTQSVKIILDRFRLPAKLPITSVKSTCCSGYNTARVATTLTGYRELAIQLDFLLQASDLIQNATYAHEIFHYKQDFDLRNINNDQQTGISAKTNNNFEEEADLASMLMMQNPCWELNLTENEVPRSQVPPITKKNVHATIMQGVNQGHPHPWDTVRKIFAVQMYEFYKEARRLLGV